MTFFVDVAVKAFCLAAAYGLLKDMFPALAVTLPDFLAAVLVLNLVVGETKQDDVSNLTITGWASALVYAVWYLAK